MVVQQFLTYIFSVDPEIEVVGMASSGIEAVNLAKEKRPDVITLEILMPGKNGFETTRMIMETVPTPIVIVSGFLQTYEVENYYKMFESGALAIVPRPPWMEDPDFIEARKMLIKAVKLMAEVKIVKRYPKKKLTKSVPVEQN
jgi:two-component system chemotaxis response regulator CheB